MRRTKEEEAARLWGMLETEEAYRVRGFEAICGVDEAGRGPLAGPVTAAAVILPRGLLIEGLNDSKKLSEKRRDALYEVVMQDAFAVGVACVDAACIDEINILQATLWAMAEAVGQLAVSPENMLVLVDGNRLPPWAYHGEAVIGGDAKCMSIAAASIIAKVTRDRLMARYDVEFPGYGFVQHKGYGTAAHIAAIEKLGVSAIHRRSFIKKEWLHESNE